MHQLLKLFMIRIWITKAFSILEFVLDFYSITICSFVIFRFTFFQQFVLSYDFSTLTMYLRLDRKLFCLKTLEEKIRLSLRINGHFSLKYLRFLVDNFFVSFELIRLTLLSSVKTYYRFHCPRYLILRKIPKQFKYTSDGACEKLDPGMMHFLYVFLAVAVLSKYTFVRTFLVQISY